MANFKSVAYVHKQCGSKYNDSLEFFTQTEDIIKCPYGPDTVAQTIWHLCNHFAYAGRTCSDKVFFWVWCSKLQ